MKSLRRTGRTNRMLKEAIHLTKNQCRVLIIARGQKQRENFILRLGEWSHKIEIKTASEMIDMGFDFMNPQDWNGTWDYDKCCIDHYVIEDLFKGMLEELHYYDEKEEVLVR
jgi:hypothetical protein